MTNDNHHHNNNNNNSNNKGLLTVGRGSTGIGAGGVEAPPIRPCSPRRCSHGTPPEAVGRGTSLRCAQAGSIEFGTDARATHKKNKKKGTKRNETKRNETKRHDTTRHEKGGGQCGRRGQNGLVQNRREPNLQSRCDRAGPGRTPSGYRHATR